MALFLGFFFLVISSATACDRCVHQSKVAYFSDSSALSSGACGYGSLALGFYNGYLAAAAPKIYSDGVGCGGCFQIRCKEKGGVCRKEGSKVIVTDMNQDNTTDFVLSRKAFTAMAVNSSTTSTSAAAQYLLNRGILEVEYKRIPCDFKGKNLSVRIEKWSKKPHYLALTFLYQGGQTQIRAVDVFGVEGGGPVASSFLSKNHGAVWDSSRVPRGALRLRLVMNSGFDTVRPLTEKLIPANWEPGMIYDLGLNTHDYLAKESCSPCDTSNWG